MIISSRFLRRWYLLICFLFSGVFGGEGVLPAEVQASIAAKHAVRTGVVYRDYLEALEVRFRSAEAEGDIDLMVLIADERDAPGEGEGPLELIKERDGLEAGLLRAERERQKDILAALKALRVDAGPEEGPDTALEELIEAAETELAGPLLGPSILPEDFFAPEQKASWRMRLPYGRRENRSGPESVEGERMFRLHQEPDHFLVISRDLVLLEEVEYLLSWEAREVKNDALAEEAGEPAVYAVGFGISDARYRTLLATAEAQGRRTVWEMAPPPAGSEWEEQQGILKTGRHMDQLMFRTSTGTGEWELRNLQIRRIY